MQHAQSIALLRQTLALWRGNGEKIAFVPTMGNLHAGHIKLVETAKASGARVVVSIFVNPTQFGVGEDFSSYPRTETEDCLKLEKAGVDLVFLPSASDLYHPDARTVVSVNALSALHCGASRPGHFDGVATIVCKLFNLVQPDLAFFGLKDYQQWLIIKTMVRDLNFPIELVPVATVREADGLAMSSRNGYLSAEERVTAAILFQTLARAKAAVLENAQNYRVIEASALQGLEKAGFKPDYFAICRADDLLPADALDTDIVILAAAKIGKTRLIDNIAFNLDKQ